MEAANALLDGSTAMYVNIHMTKSLSDNGGKALGLIRGQIMQEEEGSDNDRGHCIDSDSHRSSSYHRSDTYSEGGLRGSIKTSRKTVDNETHE